MSDIDKALRDLIIHPGHFSDLQEYLSGCTDPSLKETYDYYLRKFESAALSQSEQRNILLGEALGQANALKDINANRFEHLRDALCWLEENHQNLPEGQSIQGWIDNQRLMTDIGIKQNARPALSSTSIPDYDGKKPDLVSEVLRAAVHFEKIYSDESYTPCAMEDAEKALIQAIQSYKGGGE